MSPIVSLGNVEKIGRDGDFQYSQVTDLGCLKEIGGGAYFNLSQITNLGNLKKIGGVIVIVDSKLKEEDFNNIENEGIMVK